MIEFVLVFGAGFLGATLLAAIVSPAISRRVVAYTENRIIATMPVSPREVRAQKDMARATYAAENARIREELAAERERNIVLLARETGISGEGARVATENRDLHALIEDMTVEAGNLRSELRRAESRILDMKERLGKVEKRVDETSDENNLLRQRINQLAIDADNLRIDIATRDAEAENYRIRINSLRADREDINRRLNDVLAQKLGSETLLSGDNRKMARLEETLVREKATIADLEAAIERQTREITRLKEHGHDTAAGEKTDLQMNTIPAEPAMQMRTAIDAGERNLRNQAAALCERLVNTSGTANDEAIRQELASIAAGMVVLTAQKEGATSPLAAIVEASPLSSPRKSIAWRARNILDKNDRTNGRS